MDKREQLLRVFKKIGGLAFACAFLFAIMLFGGLGRNLLSEESAKYAFAISGGLGILFNLLSFESGKHKPLYSFIYWTGTLIVFVGLFAKLFNFPFSLYLIIAGILILGASFFIGSQRENKKTNSEDLLDN